MEKKGEKYAKNANKERKEVFFKEGDLVWVHLRKERFPHHRMSKHLPREDDPFKNLKKINDNSYKFDIPQEFGGSTTFNVDLTPCVIGTQAPNLRSNSLQEGEDGAYMGGHTQSTQEANGGKYLSKKLRVHLSQVVMTPSKRVVSHSSALFAKENGKNLRWIESGASKVKGALGRIEVVEYGKMEWNDMCKEC
ncbi:hypothetical protein CR513_12404, partial [Mucuna pruriens]